LNEFDHDATGVKEEDLEQKYTPIPKGTYKLQIVDYKAKQTKTGYQMVSPVFEVFENEAVKYNGRKVFHNVTFITKGLPGAGMCLQFLKAIREPYKDNFRVRPDNWIGKRILGYVTIETYQGKDNNKIGSVESYYDKFGLKRRKPKPRMSPSSKYDFTGKVGNFMKVSCDKCHGEAEPYFGKYILTTEVKDVVLMCGKCIG